MKNYRKIALLALLSSMLISGCQSKDTTTNNSEVSTQSKDSIDLSTHIENAIKVSQKITTFGSDLNANIIIDEEDDYSKIYAKIEIDNTDKLIGHIQSENQQNDSVYTHNLYLEELGENVSILTENETEWTEIKYSKNEALDVIGVYYGIKNFTYFLKNGQDWEEIQPLEPVAKDVITAKCTIPSNEIYEMIQNTHLLYFMGMNQIAEECYENLPDVDVILQFNTDGEPISLSVELGEVLELVSNYIAAQLGGHLQEIDVQEYNIHQTFYNLNKNIPIDIPIESRDAVNYGSEIHMMNNL